MNIKLKPKIGQVKTKVEIISEGSLKINNELFEFPISTDGEFRNIKDETNHVISKAEVKEGILYIDIPFYYTDSKVWENPNWNNTGNFRGANYEEFKKGDII